MASLGDLIQIRDVQNYLGQELENVYYYRVTSITGMGGDYLDLLLDSFVARVVSKVAVVQVSALYHSLYAAKNLSNGVDIVERSAHDLGADACGSTSQEPSFLALGWKLRRSSLATRNGSKRIAGLCEDKVTGNGWIGAGGPIGDINFAFASSLNIGLLEVASPVIVKRPINTPAGAYIYSVVANAEFTDLTTQNSRKP